MDEKLAGLDEQARAQLDGLVPPAPLSPTCAAWLAYADGEVLAAEGRATEAVASFDRVIDVATPVGNQFVISVATVSALAIRSQRGDIDEALAAFGPVLSHYRRVRSHSHGVTALRHLVGLLVRSEQDEPALVLLGALANPDVKSTYGAESELLAEAERTARQRNSPDAVAAWTAKGRSHDIVWALDYAIDLLGDAG